MGKEVPVVTEFPTEKDFRDLHNYEAQVAGKSTLEKSKENPMVPVGVVLGLGTLGYMIHNFKKNRGKVSIYLMNTRMAVQGTVVGACFLGMAYSVFFRNQGTSESEHNNQHHNSHHGNPPHH